MSSGPMTGNKATLTPDEAAIILGVTRRTIFRWIRKGKLPVVPDRTPWRIPREAIVTLLERGG